MNTANQQTTNVVEYLSVARVNVMIDGKHIIANSGDVDGFDAREHKWA